MGLLDNQAFLESLATLYASSQTRSVFVTFKPSTTKQILFRATSGATKFSTLVAPPDIQDFNAKYLNVMRVSMTSLRKKERVKQVRRKKKAVDKMVE